MLYAGILIQYKQNQVHFESCGWTLESSMPLRCYPSPRTYLCTHVPSTNTYKWEGEPESFLSGGAAVRMPSVTDCKTLDSA